MFVFTEIASVTENLNHKLNSFWKPDQHRHYTVSFGYSNMSFGFELSTKRVG